MPERQPLEAIEPIGRLGLALCGREVARSKALRDDIEVVAVEGARASVIGGAPAAAVVFSEEARANALADPRIAQGAAPSSVRPSLARGELYEAVYAEKVSGAHTDRPELAKELAHQKVTFYRGLLRVEFRLTLHACGIERMPDVDLLQPLISLETQLRQLALSGASA